MTMIINETLRLYPPVLGMTRTASREIRLGDLLLPADIELVILCLVTHNDPEIWGEDAHLFKPDRFAEGITKAAKNTMAYLLFDVLAIRNYLRRVYLNDELFKQFESDDAGVEGNEEVHVAELPPNAILFEQVEHAAAITQRDMLTAQLALSNANAAIVE
ncbi:hypothetical protein GIB67_001851 [Kingdonia uniflora]|uniref:Cytochrome P450 n=1 Tax=Kingdonia uniflora TaxID=39325 RepID=A0A7J7LN06_9MAGN|nr:hypothetical protein GIB67_001851 [Kingdonia uniflora]